MGILNFFAGYYAGLFLLIPVILFIGVCTASGGKR
jgi:hypothetical protein